MAAPIDQADGWLPAVISSIAAATVQHLGIELGVIVLAFFGAVYGLAGAREMTRGKALVMFPSVVAISAVVGTVLGAKLAPGNLPVSELIAGLVGLAGHPLAGLLLERVRPLFDAAISRMGIKKS